jgi:hypothetical protein
MTDQTEDLFIDLNPEELKKLSKILADTLVEQSNYTKLEECIPT